MDTILVRQISDQQVPNRLSVHHSRPRRLAAERASILSPRSHSGPRLSQRDLREAVAGVEWTAVARSLTWGGLQRSVRSAAILARSAPREMRRQVSSGCDRRTTLFGRFIGLPSSQTMECRHNDQRSERI
jgi:hypothetical protein